MPPLYSGSTPVSPTSCMCPENLQRKASRRVLIRAMKQRSTALLGAPHPLCDAKTPRGGKSFWPLVSAISFFRDSGVPESDVWWEMCWTSCRGNGRSSHIGYMRTRYLFSQKDFPSAVCSEMFRHIQVDLRVYGPLAADWESDRTINIISPNTPSQTRAIWPPQQTGVWAVELFNVGKIWETRNIPLLHLSSESVGKVLPCAHKNSATIKKGWRWTSNELAVVNSPFDWLKTVSGSQVQLLLCILLSSVAREPNMSQLNPPIWQVLAPGVGPQYIGLFWDAHDKSTNKAWRSSNFC